MSIEVISMRAIKIALSSVLAVLIIGSVCGWMLLNHTAATAQMSRDIKELKAHIELLEKRIIESEYVKQ
ncbi:MAG: DUF5408 family protein [Wolinella sp.]